MEPLVVPLLAGGGILFQAVLDGAAQGDVRFDDTVRFGILPGEGKAFSDDGTDV